jgi:hypothetical protein
MYCCLASALTAIRSHNSAAYAVFGNAELYGIIEVIWVATTGRIRTRQSGIIAEEGLSVTNGCKGMREGSRDMRPEARRAYCRLAPKHARGSRHGREVRPSHIARIPHIAQNGRVSLVYRIVRFPSFIGASCLTHVLESVITTNRIHYANHFFPHLCQPLV